MCHFPEFKVWLITILIPTYKLRSTHYSSRCSWHLRQRTQNINLTQTTYNLTPHLFFTMKIAENATNKRHNTCSHFDLSSIQFFHFPSYFPCDESLVGFWLLRQLKFLGLSNLLEQVVGHLNLIPVFAVHISYLFATLESKLVSILVQNLLKLIFNIRYLLFA